MNLRRIFGGTTFLFLLAVTGALHAQVITSFTPPLGSHADPDFIIVKVFGSGFAPGGHRPNTFSADFNGTLSTTSTNLVVSDSEIDLTNIPLGATTGPIHVSINGSSAQSPGNFVVINTNAYITNFTPLSGGNGTSVIVTGVHMNGTITNVSFNGKLSQAVTGLTANSITVTAPNGVTTGPLTAISKFGASRNFTTSSNVFYSATNFFVAPRITSFTPLNGRPGTNVVITGTNFIGVSGVQFGTINALGFTNLSNTSIEAVVPTNASTATITVFPPSVPVALPSATSIANFSMLPTIYSFSPTSGPPGTVLVISGAGLSEQAPHPAVTIGGGTVTTFGAFSENTLMCTVPSTATSGLITVTTTNGWISSTQLFFLPANITSFTPGRGATGTIVQINGVNFTNASAVAFNGIPASVFTVTNNTVLGAVAPFGVTSGTISITTPAGTTNSTALFFVAPTITGFTPTHGLPGTNVVITGKSFTNATAVLFNGAPATNFTVMNNTTLSAIVPAGATTGPITVAAPGGTNQSAANFTIDSADLGVTVTDAPDPVFVGSNLVYTITITNNGITSASNVRLTNTLPQSVTLKSATTSQGSLTTNANPIFGNLGTLNNGGSATVTLTVTPMAPGSITNMVAAASDALDANSANNISFAITTVLPLPLLSITNLMSNSLVRISWPAPLSNFTLQFRTDLSTSAPWTNDAGAKIVSGTNVSVTETSIPPARFFRLTN